MIMRRIFYLAPCLLFALYSCEKRIQEPVIDTPKDSVAFPKYSDYKVVSRYKSWKIFDGDEAKDYYLLDNIVLGDVQYVQSSDEDYCYRQIEDKVYRYNMVDGCEELLFDYGLHVGDKFQLFEDFCLVVECETDTLIVTKTLGGTVRNIHRCLYLRGIENNSFVDTWISGLGSLYYGLFRPATISEISASNLLVYVTGGNVLMSTFSRDNFFGTDTNLNTKMRADSAHLHFTFLGDTLCVQGYYEVNSGGELYCIAEEGLKSVTLTFSEYRPAVNSFGNHEINFKIPGLTQDDYTIQVKEKALDSIWNVAYR